uniref:homeobox protein not2-like n=1 Tax=Styela clava TaxID=7725 RepID=UPI00193A96BF|nr:homeobox protein not2-like [Styela clava]
MVFHYDSPNFNNMTTMKYSELLHSTPVPMTQYEQFYPDINESFTLSPIAQDSKSSIGNRSNTKVERIRTVFTNIQLERLEKEFPQQRYLVGEDRTALANELKLGKAQIKIWFQNRRTKFKKQMCKESPVIVDDN